MGGDHGAHVTVPAVLFVKIFWDLGSLPLLALAFGAAYPMFGFTYLFLVVVIRKLVGFRSVEGDYPFISPYAIKWAFVGSLVGLAKLLFLGHIKGMPMLMPSVLPDMMTVMALPCMFSGTRRVP